MLMSVLLFITSGIIFDTESVQFLTSASQQMMPAHILNGSQTLEVPNQSQYELPLYWLKPESEQPEQKFVC